MLRSAAWAASGCSGERGSIIVTLGDTQKQVSQFPVRHCERSEAIQGPQYDRLGCWRRACCGPWIASSQGLLAMTDGSPLTRSCSRELNPCSVAQTTAFADVFETDLRKKRLNRRNSLHFTLRPGNSARQE